MDFNERNEKQHNLHRLVRKHTFEQDLSCRRRVIDVGHRLPHDDAGDGEHVGGLLFGPRSPERDQFDGVNQQPRGQVQRRVRRGGRSWLHMPNKNRRKSD